MALLLLKCSSAVCGFEYEAITTTAEGARDAKACPQCGSVPETRVHAGQYGRGPRKSADDFTHPDELAQQLENKAYYESHAEEILSGEMGINERSVPKEFLPQVPEHLQRRYY